MPRGTIPPSRVQSRTRHLRPPEPFPICGAGNPFALLSESLAAAEAVARPAEKPGGPAPPAGSLFQALGRGQSPAPPSPLGTPAAAPRTTGVHEVVPGPVEQGPDEEGARVRRVLVLSPAVGPPSPPPSPPPPPPLPRRPSLTPPDTSDAAAPSGSPAPPPPPPPLPRLPKANSTPVRPPASLGGAEGDQDAPAPSALQAGLRSTQLRATPANRRGAAGGGGTNPFVTTDEEREAFGGFLRQFLEDTADRRETLQLLSAEIEAEVRSTAAWRVAPAATSACAL